MHYSSSGPVRGALACFEPSKPVPQFKLQNNGGQSEIMRGVGGVLDPVSASVPSSVHPGEKPVNRQAQIPRIESSLRLISSLRERGKVARPVNPRGRVLSRCGGGARRPRRLQLRWRRARREGRGDSSCAQDLVNNIEQR